jgi:hypothetical protein
VLDDNRPAICAGCGAFVLTYGKMKRRSKDFELSTRWFEFRKAFPAAR